MEDGKVIYREGPYTLVQYHSFRPEIIELFDETVWGSEGALYEHKDTRQQLERIRRPLLVEVRKGDELAGTCVFIEREVRSGKLDHTSIFMRYLIGLDAFRGKGIIKEYAAKTMRIIRASSEGPTVFIGIVEQGNKRSYKLVESVNLHKTSRIQTLSYSRFSHKDDPAVRLLKESEKDVMKKKLEEMYAGYMLWHTDNLYMGWDYYVLEEDGRIKAGLQVQKAHWVISQLPGFSGKVLIRLLPWIPIVRKIFNPADFNFAAFDYLYYDREEVKAMERLYSAVLKRMGLNTALYWFDSKSPHQKEIISSFAPGLLHRFSAKNYSFLMLGFEHMDKETMDLFQKMPAFQSSGDFI